MPRDNSTSEKSQCIFFLRKGKYKEVLCLFISHMYISGNLEHKERYSPLPCCVPLAHWNLKQLYLRPWGSPMALPELVSDH